MNQQKLVKRINELYHNWEAKYYSERHPDIFKQEKDNWQKFASNFFTYDKAKKILDVGCGTGFIAQVIGKYLTKDDEFFCSDISADMLKIAEHNLSDSNFVNKFYFLKGSIEELDFQPYSLDFVIMNSVLHHLPNIETFFEEVNKILKPGGKLIIFHEPNVRFFQNGFLRNNFLLLQYIKNIIFKFKNKSKRKDLGKKEKEDIFEYINSRLKEEGLVTQNLGTIDIKQFVDYGSPTASGKIDKNRGFDIYKIQKQYLSNFKILEFTSYNYLCKINHRSNHIFNLYNYLLSKLWPLSGSSWGVILEKNDTTN
jgi:ubiquinone/menaquinone biosynthesis C-methylase UbiE